jgi:hypothetical protein
MNYTTIPTEPEHVQAIRYTGVQSVNDMMTAWGTNGFNNTDTCLMIYGGEYASVQLRVNKGMWVVKSKSGFNSYTDTVFKQRFVAK